MIGRDHPQFVVLHEEDIVGGAEHAFFYKLSADSHEDEAKPGVGPLVHVKVVIGREGRHFQSQVHRLIQLLAVFRRAVFGEQAPHVRDGCVAALAQLANVTFVVVIRREIATQSFHDGGGILAPGHAEVLVRIHGFIAVFEAVGVNVSHDAAPFLKPAERSQHTSSVFVAKCSLHPVIGFDLLFHAPEFAHRIPVTIFVGHEDVIGKCDMFFAEHFLQDLLKRDGSLELRQVEDPVQAEVALLDVEAVFEEDHQFRQRRLVHWVPIQEFEVPEDFRQVPMLPPMQEVIGIHGHHHVVVRSEFGFFLRVAGDYGGVHVAGHLFRYPVLTEGHAEATEHVITGKPPATDVEPHRGGWLWTVQIVVPEVEFLLLFGRPLQGGFLVTKELIDNCVSVVHITAAHVFVPSELPARCVRA